jgi:hypothetical protein
MRRILGILALLSLACPARAQQPHAPAGGMYYNGQFYKGGQFVPRGAPGGVFGPSLTPSDWDSSMATAPLARRLPRRAARTAYRAEARQSARGAGSGGGTPDQGIQEDAQSKSRISMARNLMKLGKYEDARGWLNKVIETKASVTTVQDARKLLADLERRTGHSSEVSLRVVTIFDDGLIKLIDARLHGWSRNRRLLLRRVS